MNNATKAFAKFADKTKATTLNIGANIANATVDKAVGAWDSAVSLKERVDRDGVAKVADDIARDTAQGMKDKVVNAATEAAALSKKAYQGAKELNVAKAKELVKNEAFKRITNSKSAAKAPVLLATAELDTTLQQCRDDVAKIVEYCKRTNIKYTDDTFPTTAAIYADVNFPSTEFGAPKAWKRMSEIKTEPKIFKDKPISLNIDQGDVGTCFLLGSLGVLAMENGLIEELFIAHDSEVGVYGVRFFINDYWRAVIIDDFLPVNEHGVVLYGASKDRDEFWVALIEKAYAKLHMCYEHIDGGVERYAMSDLTGGVGERYDLKTRKFGINVSGMWSGIIRMGKVGLPKPFQVFISFVGGKIVGGGYTDQGIFDIVGEVVNEQWSTSFSFKMIAKGEDNENKPLDRTFTGKYEYEKKGLVGEWKDSATGSGVFELSNIEKKNKKNLKGAEALTMFSGLWDIIRERSKEKVLMTCAIEDPDETETEHKMACGLLKNHAYGITAVYEVNNNRLLRIMNPHGRGGRWNGRWGPDSAEMNVVYKKLLGVTEEDNGVFFMLYDDFVDHFNALDLCVVFNADWSVSTIRGMWRTLTCGGEENWPQNPQASFTLEDKGKVIIKLSQPTPKIYSGADSYPIGIGFKVVYCNTHVERITDIDTAVILVDIEPQYERSVSIAITLAPLDLPFFIVPYTTEPGLICPFTLSVYATTSFNLEDLSHNIDPRIPSGLWKGTSDKGQEFALTVEFEAGGCVATHNEDARGEYILKGGFIPVEDTGDFQLAFTKEYTEEEVEEIHIFTGEYKKKDNVISGTFSTTDLEGAKLSESTVSLCFSAEDSFMEELGLMVDMVTENLNQYRIGLKNWFETIFPIFFDDDDVGDDVDGDVAAVKGRSEIARAKGRSEMARAKGRAEIARVKGRAEVARAKGRAEMARVKGRAEVMRAKGRSEMARVKGRSEVARVKGRTELLRVKGRNDGIRLPEGMQVSIEISSGEKKDEQPKTSKREEPTNGASNSPKATSQEATKMELKVYQEVPVVSSGGMCGSKVCTIQ